MVDVFSKLVRLSYYGNVAGKVPEVYMQIFPPKPEPQSIHLGNADGDDTVMTDKPASTDVAGSATETEKKWTQDFVQQVRSSLTVTGLQQQSQRFGKAITLAL